MVGAKVFLLPVVIILPLGKLIVKLFSSRSHQGLISFLLSIAFSPPLPNVVPFCPLLTPTWLFQPCVVVGVFYELVQRGFHSSSPPWFFCFFLLLPRQFKRFHPCRVSCCLFEKYSHISFLSPTFCTISALCFWELSFALPPPYFTVFSKIFLRKDAGEGNSSHVKVNPTAAEFSPLCFFFFFVYMSFFPLHHQLDFRLGSPPGGKRSSISLTAPDKALAFYLLSTNSFLYSSLSLPPFFVFFCCDLYQTRNSGWTPHSQHTTGFWAVQFSANLFYDTYSNLRLFPSSPPPVFKPLAAFPGIGNFFLEPILEFPASVLESFSFWPPYLFQFTLEFEAPDELLSSPHPLRFKDRLTIYLRRPLMIGLRLEAAGSTSTDSNFFRWLSLHFPFR